MNLDIVLTFIFTLFLIIVCVFTATTYKIRNWPALLTHVHYLLTIAIFYSTMSLTLSQFWQCFAQDTTFCKTRSNIAMKQIIADVFPPTSWYSVSWNFASDFHLLNLINSVCTPFNVTKSSQTTKSDGAWKSRNIELIISRLSSHLILSS